jgi:hypothetical protein
MLTNTYATNASDISAMLVLVRAMMETKTTATIDGGTTKYRGYGAATAITDATYPYSESYKSACRSVAIADYAWESIYNARQLGAYTTYWASYSNLGGEIFASDADIQTGSVSTAIDHQFKIMGKPTKFMTYSASGFSKQGFAIPDEDTYGLLKSSDVTNSSNVIVAGVLGGQQPPPRPNDWSTISGGWGGFPTYDNDALGFRINPADLFVLVAWSFSVQ